MSNKHEVNVRKSSWLNFQIGLIASLLFTYVMFEVYTTTPTIAVNPNPEPWEEEHDWDGIYQVYVEPKQQAVVQKIVKPKLQPEDYEVVDNDKEITDSEQEFKNDLPDESSITAPGIDEIDNIKEPTDVESLPFIAVEFVPIFPGCESLETNEERAACFSEKISRIVSKKFDTSLAGDLGLKGLQRIYVQFEVYKDGTIQNIQARATHPLLEKEAIRVVERFPKMIPGKQRDRNVTVKYQLPIAFKIQD